MLELLNPERPVRRATMFALAAGVVAVDQATKWWAATRLSHGPPIVLVESFLELRYQTNTGAAFSLFEGRTSWLALFSAVISVGLIVWGWRMPAHERGLRRPLGLILGGAVGNLIDRVVLGYVIDFILAHWYHRYHWPTFNVADSAVCVGMAWLILTGFHPSSRKAIRPPEAASETASPPSPSRRRAQAP